MEFLKNHTGKIALSILAAVIGVAAGVVPYFSIARIIDRLVNGARCVESYVPFIGAVFAGFVGSMFFHELSTIVSHNAAYSIIEEQRKKLVFKLTEISMGEVQKKTNGEWTRFMLDSLDAMEKPIAHVIPEVFANVLIPIVLAVIIFVLDWRIGIANLLTIPAGFLFSALMMRGYEAKSKRYQKASKAMNTSMVEYVNGIRVIKAFNKSASSFAKFRMAVEENKHAMLDWYLSVCFSMTASMETLPATMVFVLPVSLFLFMKGSADIGTLVMCILLSYAAYRPLLKAMGHIETIANVKIIFSEIRKVMEIPALVRGTERQKIASHDVEFRTVCFSYNGEKNALSNLSFTAKEHELTAIVGDSGGGKSTIVKLIAGFWNVDSGEILIGGKNIRDMSLEQNRELVTYVSQENFLFNKSILENVKVAKEDATMEEIISACKKASCHDSIAALPNGYNTIAGEGGVSLSGGERQRICLARCFLKNAPIVLLDESTAYADPDNEAVIQQSMSALVKDKTVIMIAHRLSTIVHADSIIVIDKGKVLEYGTHETLLAKNGKYAQMWCAYTESKKISLQGNRPIR